MRRMRVKLLVVVAIVGFAVPTLAGSGVVAAAPAHPNRVLIVLFDQMLPEYANQFDMPNFRAFRDAGTNFKKAYLGYMASETVIAHNVITSGQLPKHMGWIDEAYRDTENLLRHRAGEMHITGDLSLANFGTLISSRGLSEARRLSPRRFRSGDEVHRGRGEVLRGRVRGRARPATSACAVGPVASSTRAPRHVQRPPRGRYRIPGGQERAELPDRGVDVTPNLQLRPLLHQLRTRPDRLRDQGCLPVVDLFRGRQPLLPRDRPRRSRDTSRRRQWVADAAIAMMNEELGRGCS